MYLTVLAVSAVGRPKETQHKIAWRGLGGWGCVAKNSHLVTIETSLRILAQPEDNHKRTWSTSALSFITERGMRILMAVTSPPW